MASTPGSNNGNSQQPESETTRQVETTQIVEVPQPSEPPGVPQSFAETSQSDRNAIPPTQYLEVSQQSEVSQPSRFSEPRAPLPEPPQFPENSIPRAENDIHSLESLDVPLPSGVPEASTPSQYDENLSLHPSELTQSYGTTQLDQNAITIHIINDFGKIYTLPNVSNDQKLVDLIKKSLARFYKNQKKVSKNFVIICIRTNEMLNTSQTVKENGLLHNDELLLVEKSVATASESILDETPETTKSYLKSKSSKLHDKEHNLQAPNRTNIENVTKEMKTRNKKKKKKLNESLQCNTILLQMELDNIFIALVDRSAHLVQFNNVSDIFTDIVKNARLDLKPDGFLLNKLTSMGYAVATSQAALILTGNNLMLSVEWLTTESTSVTDEDIAELLSLRMNCETFEINSDNFCEFIRNVMRYLLKAREILSDISKENINNIKNMGFQDENQIKRALRKCSDEPNKACLLLLEETPDDQMGNDGPVPDFFDKILSDPDNLVALSNKHMLFALINYFLIPTTPESLQGSEGRKYAAQLIKIVEEFEMEKYFSQGCRKSSLVILLDNNMFAVISR